VLEYWHRHDPRYVENRRIINPSAYFDWVRDRSLEEIDIVPDWARSL